MTQRLQTHREDGVFLRWLGVGGIQLRWRNKILLIDPFLTRPSILEVLFRPLVADVILLRREIASAEAILITHAHYDHLMDTAQIIQQTGARAYGSGNVVKLLHATGIPKEKCCLIQSGDSLEINPFKVRVLSGKHIPLPFFSAKEIPPSVSPPRRVWNYQMDHCYSFFLSNVSPTILIWHSIEPAGAVPAEVLLIDTEIPFSQLEELLRSVNPCLVIPIHWDDFFRPLDAPLKPFFRLPERGFFHLGRLDILAYADKVRRLLPQGKVYLPQRLQEVKLMELIEPGIGKID
ncbi:MAG: MBL fold metallo-hydrolase [Anaerolineales bacterium]